MMNQMYGPGPRGNRGGRGHFQPGRYHQNRYPHPNFKNQNNHQNNNNNPKCYNQNMDRCPNPNLDQGEFLPPGDRMYGNTGGNSPYLGNEPPAYPTEPMYHGHGPPVVYEMPFGQPHFADMGIPPPMLPQMQMVNFSAPPPYVPSSLVYGVFSQSPMPPPPQMEPFNAIKDGSSRSQSRESFGCPESGMVGPNDYGPPQSCANCVGNEARSTETIRELQTDIADLRTKNRTLQEENASLKFQLQVAADKKEEPVVLVETTEVKTGLSVNAEPFVAKPTAIYESCTAVGGQKWPPDPVDQGYEKTCTELIEIIKDKPEEAWISPVVLSVPEIPTVSANVITKWSEMLETDAAPEVPSDFNSRGRVGPEDQARLNDNRDLPQGGRGHGSVDHPPIHGPSAGYNEQARGAKCRPDAKRNAGQPSFQNRGLNSNNPPDHVGGFHAMRSSMGNNVNRNGRGGFQSNRPHGASRNIDRNWRALPENQDSESSNRPTSLERKADVQKQEDKVEGTRNVKIEARLEERKTEGARIEERKWEPQGNREESRERPKGGSGDRLRSQGSTGSDSRRMQTPDFITEIDGDLFTSDASFSLAHCVAVDMQMGSGIAVTFRDQFKRVGELLDQRKQVGEVAILNDKDRFIYYLVTKERSQGKPQLEDLETSLWAMAEHCHANGVKKLAMPRIGCGLDRLSWKDVKKLLEKIFSKCGVQITVYNYPQIDERREDTTPRKKSSLHIVQESKNLVDIETGTGLLYLCAEDNSVSPTMTSLDEKHHFLPSFRSAKRVCGDIVETTRGKEVLYGLVVKKTAKDPLSYGHLFSCLKKLRTKNNTAMFEYFGLEAFRDNGDVLTMAKIATMVRNVFGGSKYRLEFWLCFPAEFVKDKDVQSLPPTT